MLIAQIPTEAIDASSNLLQYGAIGACLVLAVIGLIFLIRYMLNAYKERIFDLLEENKESKKEIKRLNEVRAEVAVQVVELVGATNKKMDGLTEVIKKSNKRLSRIVRKLGDTRSLDDDDDDY